MSIDGIYRFVDVRDVAYAHIQAFEIPSACGRYCLVGSVAYSSEALKIIHKLYPAISLPDTYVYFSLPSHIRISIFHDSRHDSMGSDIKKFNMLSSMCIVSCNFFFLHCSSDLNPFLCIIWTICYEESVIVQWWKNNFKSKKDLYTLTRVFEVSA